MDGDVIIGNHSRLEYGIAGNMVILGEGVYVGGGLKAGADARIDMWARIGGNVEVAGNAYLGEFAIIEGKLTSNGDLDVGKNVKINGGFEVKGWVVVRNPLPVLFFLFLYIREMMRLGKDEEVEKALDEFFGDRDVCPEFAEKVLIIPPDAKISVEAIDVPGKALIGNRCMLRGNIHADSLEIGEDLTLQGSLHSGGKTTIGDRATVHGNLYSGGQVRIGKDSHIIGEIKANSVFLHESSKVEGRIKAPFGVTFLRDREAGGVGNESEAELRAGVESKVGIDDISGAGPVQPMEIIEIETFLKPNAETPGPEAPVRETSGVSGRAVPALRVPGIVRKGVGTQKAGKIRNYPGARSRRRRLKAGKNRVRA